MEWFPNVKSDIVISAMPPVVLEDPIVALPSRKATASPSGTDPVDDDTTVVNVSGWP